MGNRNVQPARCPPDHEHTGQIRADVVAIQTGHEHEHPDACRHRHPLGLSQPSKHQVLHPDACRHRHPPPRTCSQTPGPLERFPAMPSRGWQGVEFLGSDRGCPVYLRLPIRAAKESDHGKKV